LGLRWSVRSCGYLSQLAAAASRCQ